MNSPTKDRFGYDNNVSLQTDDVGHVGAAVRRNRKGFTSKVKTWAFCRKNFCRQFAGKNGKFFAMYYVLYQSGKK